jgi:hypothetical protein
MFGLGKVTCAFCEGRVSPKDVLRAKDWKDIVICAKCYAHWTSTGRTCVQCGVVVEGTQATSAFLKPRHAFGHADCGGMRLIPRESPVPS